LQHFPDRLAGFVALLAFQVIVLRNGGICLHIHGIRAQEVVLHDLLHFLGNLDPGHLLNLLRLKLLADNLRDDAEAIAKELADRVQIRG